MAEELENNQKNTLEQAIQQFVDAQLRGERPDIDEFVKQYPGLEQKIRQRIRNLQEIDGLFSCLMQADDSDFAAEISEHNLIGQTLGDFKILSIIGTGGMGAVFLAHQISLDRDVALKVISDISGARKKSIERFGREAKVLAKISHPNIVPIYEVGQQGQYSYFAMEFVKGVSLSKIIDAVRKSPQSQKASDVMAKCLFESGISSTEQTKKENSGAEVDTDYIISISRIIISIASALEYAHKQGVLHRDVKPSNILIKPDGTAKLVDFGLARAETQQAITVSGEFFGTPSYVSPEQIRKPETVDCRSDVYSLAATYYECLTLRPPFEGNTVNETLTRVISQEAISPQKYCPRLSTDFNTVLLHALEKLPEDRYQTAADFAADIENVLDFRPITAKRPSITRRAYKAVRRNPIKIIVSLVITVAIAIGITLTILYVRENKIADAGRLHAEGLAKMASGHHAEALVCFKKALVKDPTHVQAAYLGALCYQELGDPNKAILLYKHAVKIGPNCAEAYFGLALGYQVLNRWEESIGPLEKAVMLDPNNANYKEVLAAAYQQSENYQDAIKTYREYLAIKPDNASVCNRLGYCCSMYKQYGDAVQAYKKTIQLEPKNVTAHLSLGWCYLQLREYKPAIKSAEEALRLDPENLGAASCIIASYFNLGQNDKFIEACRKAMEIDPNYSIDWVIAGDYTPKPINSAPPYLTADPKTGKVDPNLAKCMYLAATYALLNRPECTIRLCQQAARIDPNQAMVYIQVAIAYQVLNRHKEAIDAFKKAISLDPNNYLYPAISLDLARSLAVTGQYQEAVDSYKKVIQIDPNDAETHSLLGDLYATLGRYQEAIESCTQACKLTDYKNHTYIATLANVYAKSGDFEKAVEYQKKAIELADDQAKKEYEKRLESYKAKKPWRE
jgi:tetratricopeptide (TPR) repeat protein